MKKFIFIIIIAIAVFAVYPYASEFFGTSDKNGEDVVFTVVSGENAKDIAKNLKANGLIKNEILFSLKLKITNSAAKLRSGTFNLNTGMSLSTIITKLTTEGGGDSFTLVVPEGYSAEQIAQKLETDGIMSADEFLSAMSDEYGYDFIKKFPTASLNTNFRDFCFRRPTNFSKPQRHTKLSTQCWANLKNSIQKSAILKT